MVVNSKLLHSYPASAYFGHLLLGLKHMVTQLKIDEKLLDKALDLSNHSTVNLLIEEALLEYIQRREQLKVLDLFCTIDYEEDYDYKEKRKVR